MDETTRKASCPNNHRMGCRRSPEQYVPQLCGGLGSWVLRPENARKEKLLYFFLGFDSGRLGAGTVREDIAVHFNLEGDRNLCIKLLVQIYNFLSGQGFASLYHCSMRPTDCCLNSLVSYLTHAVF